MTENDIPSLVSILRENPEADMDQIAVESIYNAVHAFYKVFFLTVRSIKYSLLISTKFVHHMIPRSVARENCNQVNLETYRQPKKYL